MGHRHSQGRASWRWGHEACARAAAAAAAAKAVAVSRGGANWDGVTRGGGKGEGGGGYIFTSLPRGPSQTSNADTGRGGWREHNHHGRWQRRKKATVRPCSQERKACFRTQAQPRLFSVLERRSREGPVELRMFAASRSPLAARC